VTGPAGLAVHTRLLCDCGEWTGIYAMSGGLWVPGQRFVAAEDREPFPVTCRMCKRPGMVDPVGLRHAIAEGRRKFRIE
jgi:hypothetical protein